MANNDFERVAFKPADTMLHVLIRDYANQYFGSNRAFAEYLGTRPETISAWMQKKEDPLKSQYVEKITQELGRPLQQLQILGKISVEEGADIVISYLGEHEK